MYLLVYCATQRFSGFPDKLPRKLAVGADRDVFNPPVVCLKPDITRLVPKTVKGSDIWLIPVIMSNDAPHKRDLEEIPQ